MNKSIAAIIILVVAVILFVVEFVFVANCDLGIFWQGISSNLATEFLSIAVTVLIIDWLVERRQKELLKISLVGQLGSKHNVIAESAANELRSHGWLTDGTLKSAKLRSADLTDADLRDANLHGADLTAAKLTSAVLFDVDLANAQLIGANIQRALLDDCNLQDAMMNGADLRDSRLVLANLRGTILTGADLRRANLQSADMHDTNLYGADLSEVTPGRSLSLDQLRSAKRLDEAIMPDGTKLYSENNPSGPTFEEWLAQQDPEKWLPWQVVDPDAMREIRKVLSRNSNEEE